MKNILKIIIFASIFALFSGVIVYAINTQNEGFRIAKNSPMDVRVHNDCKKITNKSDIGNAFIPTKSIEEWNDLKDKKPNYLEMNDCVVETVASCDNITPANLWTINFPTTESEQKEWKEKVAALRLFRSGSAIPMSEKEQLYPLVDEQCIPTDSDPWNQCDFATWKTKVWLFPGSYVYTLIDNQDLEMSMYGMVTNWPYKWQNWMGLWYDAAIMEYNSYVCAWKKVKFPDVVRVNEKPRIVKISHSAWKPVQEPMATARYFWIKSKTAFSIEAEDDAEISSLHYWDGSSWRSIGSFSWQKIKNSTLSTSFTFSFDKGPNQNKKIPFSLRFKVVDNEGVSSDPFDYSFSIDDPRPYSNLRHEIERKDFTTIFDGTKCQEGYTFDSLSLKNPADPNTVERYTDYFQKDLYRLENMNYIPPSCLPKIMKQSDWHTLAIFEVWNNWFYTRTSFTIHRDE